MSEHHHHEKDHSPKEHKRENKTKKSSAQVLDLSKILNAKVLVPVIVAVILVGGFLLLLSKGWIVAATVNGSSISRHEVRNLVEKDAGADVLRGLISQKLIDQEVKNKKISISADAINAEIATISDLLEEQGLTFGDALEGQGLSMEDARDQIKRQLELEVLLAEKVVVSDEEIDEFIAQNEISLPEDDEEEELLRVSIREQLEQQKLYNEYLTLESQLRNEANIKFFVDYLDSKE